MRPAEQRSASGPTEAASVYTRTTDLWPSTTRHPVTAYTLDIGTIYSDVPSWCIGGLNYLRNHQSNKRINLLSAHGHCPSEKLALTLLMVLGRNNGSRNVIQRKHWGLRFSFSEDTAYYTTSICLCLIRAWHSALSGYPQVTLQTVCSWGGKPSDLMCCTIRCR